MRRYLVSLCVASCLCMGLTSSASAQQCPGEGDCFVANGTPGCADTDCCNNVCAVDPACCVDGWDALCAARASVICGFTPSAPCCFSPVDCIDLDPIDCDQLGGFFGDIGQTCAVDGCPEQTEACCNPDTQMCIDDLPPSACTLLGAIPLGPGTTCALASCTTVACCFGGGECADLIAEECMNQGGSPQVFGSTCAITECPTLCGGLGGNCFIANGSPGCDDPTCCALICTADPFCCDTTWDTVCANAAIDSCVQPIEACCFFDGTCQEITGSACIGLGGTAQGAGSDCTTAGCLPEANEACCLGVDGGCLDLQPTPCADQGGTPQGIGTDCATFMCPIICGGETSGDCFSANGTPGCTDAACCNAICAADAFCCETEWDQVCVDAAFVGCAGAPMGACCFFDASCQVLTPPDCEAGNGTYQGDGTDCGSVVCVAEDTEACCLGLDGLCQELQPTPCADQGGTPQGAGTTCEGVTCPMVCGDPLAGDCFAPNGTIGCNDAECCNIVCADDPFCCETEWDQLCADGAFELCPSAPMEACCFFDGNCLDLTTAACGTQGGTAQGPGSDCTTAICVAELSEACCLGLDGSCQLLQPTPCTDQGGTPQGVGSTCETVVCPVICGDPLAGDCFVANGTIGCNEPECCNIVCADDPFCCETEWDQVCADGALELCSGAPTEACCIFDGSCLDLTTVACGDQGGTSQGPGSECTTAVCPAELPEACCLGFVGNCQDLQPTPCAAQGGTPQGLGSTCETATCPVVCPGTGDCFVANGTVGCDDADCCDTVCTDDAFCCETDWDQLCADSAALLCAGGTCDSCPGDVNGDGVRNGLDVQAMTDCLLDPTNGPGLPASADCTCADMDSDTDVDLDDVPGFVDAIINTTGPCPNPACGDGAGDCFSNNGSPGCDDAECCNNVCAADAYCCDTLWDDICAAEAQGICNGVPTEACCGVLVECIDVPPADCSSATLGGTPQGPGTTCAADGCP